MNHISPSREIRNKETNFDNSFKVEESYQDWGRGDNSNMKYLIIINIYLIDLLLNFKLYKRINKKSDDYIVSLMLFIFFMVFQSIILLGISSVILNI